MKECTMEVKTLVRSKEGMRGHELGFWVLKNFLICAVFTQMITLGLSTLLCVCVCVCVCIYIYIYMSSVLYEL